jgi:hypothetical protein
MMHNFNVSHGFSESAVGTALSFKATVSPHPVLVIESNSSILLFGEIRNTLGGIRLPSQTVCTIIFMGKTSTDVSRLLLSAGKIQFSKFR